jgi:hypothetical protein
LLETFGCFLRSLLKWNVRRPSDVARLPAACERGVSRFEPAGPEKAFHASPYSGATLSKQLHQPSPAAETFGSACRTIRDETVSRQ